MNQRKTNKVTWYSLGLAVLLCAAALVAATGTSLARYRSEREASITFEVRSPAQICLGTVNQVTEEDSQDTVDVFEPGIPEWETDGDPLQLKLAVANGLSDEEYSAQDQKVKLQLIGTLGLWTDVGVAEIYLRLPSEEKEGEYTDLKAEYAEIEAGTALANAHGDGWVYTFQDENEEELSWILPGGVLSYISLTIVIKGAVPSDSSLLQPIVTAELISE